MMTAMPSSSFKAGMTTDSVVKAGFLTLTLQQCPPTDAAHRSGENEGARVLGIEP
jgi:hypothetical protein